MFIKCLNIRQTDTRERLAALKEDKINMYFSNRRQKHKSSSAKSNTRPHLISRTAETNSRRARLEKLTQQSGSSIYATILQDGENTYTVFSMHIPKNNKNKIWPKLWKSYSRLHSLARKWKASFSIGGIWYGRAETQFVSCYLSARQEEDKSSVNLHLAVLLQYTA